MSLKIEIESFIRSNNRPLENLDRDIEIILHFFGFGNEFSPTLESTANNFGNLTRERVRQIIEKKFRKFRPQDHNWLFLKEIASKLESDKYISGQDFSKFISKHEIFIGIKGVLNLLNEVYSDFNFSIFDEQFEKSLRSPNEEFYLIEDSLAKKLQANLKQLIQFCGRDGLICLQIALDSIECTSIETAILKNHITKIKEIKTIENDGKIFYLAENWNNVIENSISKIFSTGEMFTLDAIATGIIANFSKRPPERFDYASIELILKYLTRSSYISEFNNTGMYVSKIGKTELSDGERKIVDFLELNPFSNSPEIREHLRQEGISDPFISKLLKSPFIFEDRIEGRTYYKYSLLASHPINAISVKEFQVNESSYTNHLESKLSLLSGQDTDIEASSSQRAEQNILRSLLFKKFESERCGICSRLFPINALVAAHKKKRSECNEDERLDQRIVMPMCKLGCDFLYETGLIGIKEGKVIILRDSEYNELMMMLQNLENKKVDPRWIENSEKYFEHHIRQHLKKTA